MTKERHHIRKKDVISISKSSLEYYNNQKCVFNIIDVCRKLARVFIIFLVKTPLSFFSSVTGTAKWFDTFLLS